MYYIRVVEGWAIMKMNFKTAANVLIGPVVVIFIMGVSCGRKGDFAHDAYILEDNVVVTREAGKASVRTGTLGFLDGVRFVAVDKAIGKVRVESVKGIAGWIDLKGTSQVPADWKEVIIDDYISIHLPPGETFKTMKNEPDPEEGGLTEYKFFNENYFINMVHSEEHYSESVSQAKTVAAQSGDGSVARDLLLNGLEGVFHVAPADVEGMTVITWTIRGKKNDSYIFSVIMQKERAGGEYEVTARRILFSARGR